ncbi:MAG: acyl-CoA thioesterase [Chitinophagaceae bacterium]|nr:acyl-CoA thioesterase [Chitinophagaceae bacterium]
MENYLQSFYTVRFSDCDPFRHLNNARYIDYFLNAREDHLKEFYQLDLSELYKKGQGWVVLQHEITYIRPAAFNESVCIRSGLLGIGPEHLHLEMLMLDSAQRQLKSIMHTRFVPISLATGKRQPHSPEFMSFLADKVLTEVTGTVPALGDRQAYWQNQLNTFQTA